MSLTDRDLEKIGGLLDERIAPLEEKVDANGRKIDVISKKVEENGRKIDANRKKIEANAKKIEENGKKIESNAKKIEVNGRKIEFNAKKIEANSKLIRANAKEIKSNGELIKANSERIEDNATEIRKTRISLKKVIEKNNKELIKTFVTRPELETMFQEHTEKITEQIMDMQSVVVDLYKKFEVDFVLVTSRAVNTNREMIQDHEVRIKNLEGEEGVSGG